MSSSSSNNKSNSLGCLYVLGIGVICILLLVANGVLVRSFLQANPDLFSDLRIEQAIQYVVPVLMIFFEFWLYDLVMDRK